MMRFLLDKLLNDQQCDGSRKDNINENFKRQENSTSFF